MSDGAKATGVIGGIVAAIGAVALHGADDCARIGARSASVGDDLARVGARGAAVEGAGVRGGRAVPGVGDDLARVPGRRSPLGVPLVTDEAVAGSSPWRKLAEEIGGEVAPNALEALLDSESAELEDDGEGAQRPKSEAMKRGGGTEPRSRGELDAAPTTLPRSGYSLVSLVPVDAVGFGLAFGTKTEVTNPSRFSAVTEPSDVIGTSAPRTRSALLSALVDQPAPISRFVLGYVASGDGRSLAMPSVYAQVPLAELAARCSGAGVPCALLVCERQDFSRPEPCALGARSLVDTVVTRAPSTAKKTLRALLEERAKRKVDGLTVYSAVRIDGRLRLAKSRD